MNYIYQIHINKLECLLIPGFRNAAFICSGEASSDEVVMQNSLRMRKHDPACEMHSRSKSMSYQPIFTSYRNASISDYSILLRHSVEVKLPLPRQISSQ